MMTSDFNAEVSGARMQQLYWRDVRKDVAAVNPALAKIIDKIDPNDSYRVYRCAYPYGSEIVYQGVLAVPNTQNQLVAITDSGLSKQVREDLSYNLNASPVSLLLTNSMEMFYNFEGRTVLFGLIRPGEFSGTLRLLDEVKPSANPVFLWNMSAGARSVFMLPKISDALGHNNLKRAFRMYVDKPEGFAQHWQVFRHIVNAHPEEGKSKWECEVLFFAKKWFDRLTDPMWQPLHYFLLQENWNKTSYLRNLVFWNSIYGMLQCQLNMKSSSYTNEKVRHLLAMGVGVLPGFSPALDEQALPVKMLQKAYLEVYRLKNYLPIVMQPHSFEVTTEHPRPIYYSLQFPTSMRLAPKTVGDASAFTELMDIATLLEQYLERLRQGTLNIQGTPMEIALQRVDFDFIHTSVNATHGMKPIAEVMKRDPALHHTLVKSAHNKTFPENSSFFRGAVCIAQKSQE